MKHALLLILLVFSFLENRAQSDTTLSKKWIRNKIAFGRSQHIQYLNNGNIYKTNTLFNKSYYASFSPIQIKGFKPFVALSYDYFTTYAYCYTCTARKAENKDIKQLHFINFASLGLGFSQEFTVRNKRGKQFEFIFGASIERYLFKRAFILDAQGNIEKVTPFTTSNLFFNQYFFKDLYGFRIYNSQHYKVFVQLSGLLLRNERLNYLPSRYTFHNFMLGFNIYLK